MKRSACPICGAEMRGAAQEWPDYPFCSARCRQIDLGRWLGETYRFPASDPDDGPPDEDHSQRSS